MLNRYDGKCADCAAWVWAGQGNVARAATGKWEVRHLLCPDIEDEIRHAEYYDMAQVFVATRAAVDAKVLSDYAADPAGTRARIRKDMNEAARYMSDTLDYSTPREDAAYHEAKRQLALLPEVGTLDWANASPVTDWKAPWPDSGYYSYSRYNVPVVGGIIDIPTLSEPLYKAAGQNGASYGKFGGYTTDKILADNGDGTVLVESTYHHGD